jgi:hypothetical protein
VTKSWIEAVELKLDYDTPIHRKDVRRLVEMVKTHDAIIDRLVTIIDEAFGPQPVMAPDELLTLLEQKLFEARKGAP